jgi:hypothetical protein
MVNARAWNWNPAIRELEIEAKNLDQEISLGQNHTEEAQNQITISIPIFSDHATKS